MNFKIIGFIEEYLKTIIRTDKSIFHDHFYKQPSSNCSNQWCRSSCWMCSSMLLRLSNNDKSSKIYNWAEWSKNGIGCTMVRDAITWRTYITGYDWADCSLNWVIGHRKFDVTWCIHWTVCFWSYGSYHRAEESRICMSNKQIVHWSRSTRLGAYWPTCFTWW